MDILKLREAIEASWEPDTAYLRAEKEGNSALGQCYPTARVVQHYFPEMEIVEGEVITTQGSEKHFWNIMRTKNNTMHIDLTWQQFPHGSVVKNWKVRDRNALNDSPETIRRVETLLSRVKQYLAQDRET